MEEFRNFEKYVGAVDKYGMQSGIVLIDPPEEWYDSLLSPYLVSLSPLFHLIRRV